LLTSFEAFVYEKDYGNVVVSEFRAFLYGFFNCGTSMLTVIN